jgi:peptide/nickel transport system permease protein
MPKLASSKPRIASRLRGIARIVNVILHNKRGVLGIAILVLFTFIALATPLLTPYDPLSTSQNIASPLAFPSWLRYLPGYGNLSSNVNPVKDPGFSSNESMLEWNFTEDVSIRFLSLNYSPNEGMPISEQGSGPGCLAVYMQRDEHEPDQQVEALLTKEFSYSYSDPPEKWAGTIGVKVEVGNVSVWGVNVTVFIQQAGGQRKDLWNASQGGDYASGAWIEPSITGENMYPLLIDSDILDSKREMFSNPANYTFGVAILFSQQVSNATVYIDDLNLKLYGEAFGWLGTDNLARDIFSQLLYGTRISLLVGLLGALLSTAIGLGVGMVAGYFGRGVDEVLMRITDTFLVIPELPLLMVLVAVWGQSLWFIILLISILGWMGFARIVRSLILTLKERPFVEASRALGAGELHIISKIMIPNVMNFVYVTLAMSAPAAIYSEAYLSFLGLYDASMMTWGRMLHDALLLPRGVQRWWWVVPPGLSIAAISIAFILIGHALDEIFNPKLRERF